MNKVNEWEHDAINILGDTSTTTYIPKNSNELFIYSSAEELLANTLDLKAFIERFLTVEVPRLEILKSYTTGNNYGIMHRPKRNNRDRADYRVAHNFGGYISKLNTGYLFGIPVKITNKDALEESDNASKGAINKKEEDVLKTIAEANNLNALNYSLGYDCSVYGRAFELHYRNSEDEDRIVQSSTFETFMIYDNTVEAKPIMAVRLPSYTKNNETVLNIEIYTKNAVYYCFETPKDNIEIIIDETRTQENMRGLIQIIDWHNNDTSTGDFEGEIRLIDLYDYSQADTANYMTDFNEALLVISGDLDSTGLEYDKDANMLVLKSGVSITGGSSNIKANYIYKQYDVEGTEAYKRRLLDDIHKFTLTPALDDRSFGQVASGEAQKYKLWGTEQLRSTKERHYTTAIKQRYRLINTVKVNVGEFFIDPNDLEIEFTENIPRDYWTEIKMYYDCGGELSLTTLMSQLESVDNVQDELNKLEYERLQQLETEKDIEYNDIDVEDYLSDDETKDYEEL